MSINDRREARVRIYETTFIVNPQTDNASIEQSVRAVGDLITSNGGKIIKEDHMGTRRLAYEIAGLTQGYYATFIFESDAKVLPILERHFKLEDPYIRHLLIRFDGDPKWLEQEPEQVTERPAPAPMQSPTGGRRPEARPGEPVPESKPETARPETGPVAEKVEEATSGESDVAPKVTSEAETETVPETKEETSPAPAEEKTEEAKPEEEKPAEEKPEEEKKQNLTGGEEL
ncbi:30S ribosomal protein S6 [candidate division GN15 bacterium]|nr:30S ribosomal protein S6 [candidate division GN15 bacterium]